MWRWIGLALTAGVLLVAFSVSIGNASTTTNPYPVGRAVLNPGGTLTGEVIVRRLLTAGTTQVSVRLSGLSASAPPPMTIESGADCGVKSTATLITQSAAAAVTALNTSMTSTTYPVTLTVAGPGLSSYLTVHVYAGSTTGTELACGRIYNQPSQTGSSHWW